jgi:hypothetical protein
MVGPIRQKAVVSLYEAAWRFAPASLRSEARRRRAEPQPLLPRGKFGSHGDAWISVAETVRDGLARMTDPSEPTREMKDWMVRKLAEGKFQALGVMTKPDLERQPQPIPSHFFKGQPRIDWSSNAMENLQHRFEIIEVVRAHQAQRPTSPEIKEKRRPGRPSVDDEITTVIRELKRKKAFSNRLEKERVVLVQVECRERYPKQFPKPTQPSKTKVRELLARESV